jgi:cbb3-type cytochrome oxidase maturation protein
MTILFIMIPMTLLLVAAACFAFFWAVGAGQFEDLDASAWEILVDDPQVQRIEADAVHDS